MEGVDTEYLYPSLAGDTGGRNFLTLFCIRLELSLTLDSLNGVSMPSTALHSRMHSTFSMYDISPSLSFDPARSAVRQIGRMIVGVKLRNQKAVVCREGVCQPSCKRTGSRGV